MSYPMNSTESMHHNVLSHLSIAVAKLMYEMNLEETESRYDQEYFIRLDPDKNVVLTIELLIVPKGERKENNMSTDTSQEKGIHGHTVDEDFQHFLSCSGHWEDSEETIALLKEAYTAAWESEKEIIECLERRK